MPPNAVPALEEARMASKCRSSLGAGNATCLGNPQPPQCPSVFVNDAMESLRCCKSVNDSSGMRALAYSSCCKLAIENTWPLGLGLTMRIFQGPMPMACDATKSKNCPRLADAGEHVRCTSAPRPTYTADEYGPDLDLVFFDSADQSGS